MLPSEITVEQLLTLPDLGDKLGRDIWIVVHNGLLSVRITQRQAVETDNAFIWKYFKDKGWDWNLGRSTK